MKIAPREKQIIALLLEGCDNKAIAKKLGIEEGSVKSSFSRIFAKLHIRSGSKRVKLALLLYNPESDHKTDRRRPHLHERQKRLIELVAAGMTNQEIACQTGTTEQVIKNQLKVIYDELGLSVRVEVALWYLKRKRSRQAMLDEAGVTEFYGGA